MKFIDSFKFMSSSLSNLVDNLSEGLHGDKCIDCKSRLDYKSVRDDERFDETPLPYKETFYSTLNMEDITDVDHRHAKECSKTLIVKI